MLALTACDWWKLGAGVTGHSTCPANQTVWKCVYLSTPCFLSNAVYVCAGDEASAKVSGKDQAEKILLPRDPSSVVIDQCINTGNTVVPQDLEPKIRLQDNCDGTGGMGLGTGGSAPACGESGAACEYSSECCSPLVCSLNSCD